jgi:hypothetical protein
MLPGFRFLFAAIMLSVSLLVFGLGAASLFRAAHQAFASNPSWRGASDVTFAQKGEANPPMLAALRVEPPTSDKTQTEIAVAPPTAPPSEPAPLDAEPAPAQLAALKPAEAQPADIAGADGVKAEMPAAQTPPATEPAPQPAADITIKSDQTNTPTIATAAAPPEKSEPAIAAVEPSPTQPGPAPSIPATTPDPGSKPGMIATLGGPPVEIVPDTAITEKATKVESAKSDQSAVKKRAHARRSLQRRRLAARARLAAQQLLQQQQVDPFTQPFPQQTSVVTPAPTKRHRQAAVRPAP